jgi:hypothetical protein
MMELQEAADILARAERDLRALIERALAEQRYRDVVAIASIADKQAELLSTVEKGGAGEVPTVSSDPLQKAGRFVTRKTRNRAALAKEEPREASVRSADYPRFEREGDRLVKVGWSKKDRRTYEHRAARKAILAFVRGVNEKAADDKIFTMEELLPLTSNGEEVPTYQAYLALAWLRDLGVIERKGKSGYVLQHGPCSQEAMTNYWKQLPAR